MTRMAASTRLQRLLSIVPWIVDHPGATVAEVCSRFAIDEPDLLGAFDLLQFVGVHPFSPDALIDVVLEDGCVWLHLAQPFGRPLRLTPEEGLALVAAGRSMVGSPGVDADGSLARGLAKLARSLGITDDGAVDVRLAAEVAPELLERLRTAARERRRVAIEYYSFARDEQTTREIDPHQVFADQGRWYVAAWCHRAKGERIFRVDRISRAEALDVGFEPPPPTDRAGTFHPGPDAPRVVLDLESDARWVAEHYPYEDLEALGDGRLRITLTVTARPWLERLLLSLGPDATVVEVDDRLGGPGVRAAAASRVLRRYGIEGAMQ